MCHSVCVCVFMCVCACSCVCHSVCVCACVCGRNEPNVYTTLAYPRISAFDAIHKHVHTRILKPFEDSEPMGLKVDIAGLVCSLNRGNTEGTRTPSKCVFCVCVCLMFGWELVFVD